MKNMNFFPFYYRRDKPARPSAKERKADKKAVDDFRIKGNISLPAYDKDFLDRVLRYIEYGVRIAYRPTTRSREKHITSEDIVHDACVSALDNLITVDNGERLFEWCLSVARNTVCEHFGTLYNITKHFIEYPDFSISMSDQMEENDHSSYLECLIQGEGNSPEEICEIMFVASIVKEIIDSLLPDDRSTLSLVFKGVKVKDVSNIMGLGTTKIYRLINRVKNNIRKAVSRQDISPELIQKGILVAILPYQYSQ